MPGAEPRRRALAAAERGRAPQRVLLQHPTREVRDAVKRVRRKPRLITTPKPDQNYQRDRPRARSLPRWMKPLSVSTTLVLAPSHTQVRFDPLGVGLIIGTWNYPVMLTLSPLVAAISAGNAAVIKPSEAAAATAEVIARLVPEYMDGNAFSVAPRRCSRDYRTPGTGVGPHLFYWRPDGRQNRHGRGSKELDAGRARTGWKESDTLSGHGDE